MRCSSCHGFSIHQCDFCHEHLCGVCRTNGVRTLRNPTTYPFNFSVGKTFFQVGPGDVKRVVGWACPTCYRELLAIHEPEAPPPAWPFTVTAPAPIQWPLWEAMPKVPSHSVTHSYPLSQKDIEQFAEEYLKAAARKEIPLPPPKPPEPEPPDPVLEALMARLDREDDDGV